MPIFEELPFFKRPDLTPYLVHLTKNTQADDGYTALDNLIYILQTGEIWETKKLVRGPFGAACFMDIPFISLKYVLTPENCNPRHPRYEPYGIFVGKKYAYQEGCRPVLYLSTDEIEELEIPESEHWRIVKFEVTEKNWISWIHEREWRCKGNFELPRNAGVIVKSHKEVTYLQKKISKNPDRFAVIPRAILPLEIICQGLEIK